MWYILWQSVCSHSQEMAQRYIFDFCIFSDSITLCSCQWKRRCCGDSLAQWSQHPWKRCKKWQKWEVVEEMERLRDRVNNYENGDLRGRWFVCEWGERERERERERICVLFGENGFDELESDILFLWFLCFGFVNCLGHLIIEWCVYSLIFSFVVFGFCFWFLHTLKLNGVNLRHCFLFSVFSLSHICWLFLHSFHSFSHELMFHDSHTLSFLLSSLSLPLPVLLSPSLPLFHFALFYISIICSLTVDDLRGYTLLDRRMKGCHNIHQIHAKYEEREKERGCLREQRGIIMKHEFMCVKEWKEWRKSQQMWGRKTEKR